MLIPASHQQLRLHELARLSLSALPDDVSIKVSHAETIAHHLAYLDLEPDASITLNNYQGIACNYTVTKIAVWHDGLICFLLLPEEAHGDLKIVFRGTHNLGSILRDFELNAAGHESFSKNVTFINNGVSEALSAMQASPSAEKELTVSVYGHSLGGADAQRYVVELLRRISSDADNVELPGFAAIKQLNYFVFNPAGIGRSDARDAINLIANLAEAKQCPRINGFAVMSDHDIVPFLVGQPLFFDLPPTPGIIIREIRVKHACERFNGLQHWLESVVASHTSFYFNVAQPVTSITFVYRDNRSKALCDLNSHSAIDLRQFLNYRVPQWIQYFLHRSMSSLAPLFQEQTSPAAGALQPYCDDHWVAVGDVAIEAFPQERYQALVFSTHSPSVLRLPIKLTNDMLRQALHAWLLKQFSLAKRLDDEKPTAPTIEILSENADIAKKKQIITDCQRILNQQIQKLADAITQSDDKNKKSALISIKTVYETALTNCFNPEKFDMNTISIEALQTMLKNYIQNTFLKNPLITTHQHWLEPISRVLLNIIMCIPVAGWLLHRCMASNIQKTHFYDASTPHKTPYFFSLKTDHEVAGSAISDMLDLSPTSNAP